MMGTRQELAEALTPVLPKNFRIVDHPKSLDQLAASIKACIVIVRSTVAPAPNAQGNYLEGFELWLIEPKTDEDGRSEDSLDANLDLLLPQLRKLSWLKWTLATRSTLNETYPAYKLDVTVVGTT